MGTGQQEISRRDFLGAALAAGTLGAAWSARAPFMSVGICDPSGHGEDFAAYGYTFVEPAVHRFLVPERSEAAFQANRADARKAGLPTPVANQFLPSSLKVVGGEADHEAALRYVAGPALQALNT